MGAAPPATEGEDYILGVVNVGETDETVPRNFSEFDPNYFRKNILSHFYKFVLRASKSSCMLLITKILT